MNVKLKSDSPILAFFRSGGVGVKLGALLLVGALFILLGSIGTVEKKAAQSDEERVAEMCSLAEGVGRCEVMLSYGEGGEVVAALVLCEGADSAAVRQRVVSMISSLYGIGTHRIEVVKISN